jgi:hypothetical protein
VSSRAQVHPMISDQLIKVYSIGCEKNVLKRGMTGIKNPSFYVDSTNVNLLIYKKHQKSIPEKPIGPYDFGFSEISF